MKGLIFTLGLTYGGAVAALLNPFYGFLVYVCFGIVRPQGMWPWSVPEGNYSRIIAGALILGWMVHGFGNWNFGRARGILGWLGVFWLVVMASMTQAANLEVAWHYFESLTKVLLPLAIGCTLVTSRARLDQLVWVIVLSQGFVAYEMNLSYFQGNNRMYWVGFAGLDNNTAAVPMVVAASVAFFLALHETSRWRQGIAGIVFLLSTHAVMFSFSRGALLSLIVAGLVAFLMIPKRPAYIAALVVAALIGFRMAGPEVVARFVTVFANKEERDSSAESRFELWKACMAEMKAHPVLGVGPDHFRLVAHHHGFTRNKAAHSTWMQAAAECGVVGVLALLAFHVMPIVRLWGIARGRGQGSEQDFQPYAQMVVCSLCGYIVAAQFVSVSLVEISYYVVAVGVGTLRLASIADYAAMREPVDLYEAAYV